MNSRPDFSIVADPAEVEMRPEAVEILAKVFESQVGLGLHPAAQMVVLRRGKVVFDGAIGTAHGKPINHNTSFLTFSCAKAFTAVCIHQLIEQGKIELDAPIAEYWPQFGVKGKENATIRHVFLHQAGIPAEKIRQQIPYWTSWRLITRSVANLRVEYDPGSKTAYHLVNYGFVLGEVIRRVSGIRVDKYLDQNFLKPLGLSRSWLKMPFRELRRSPYIFVGCEDQDQIDIARVFNNPILRSAINPAASLHSTARDMAVFYQMLINGGEMEGIHYLKPQTILDAVVLGYKGWDTILEGNVQYAHGFHLGGGKSAPDMPGPTMGERSTQRTFGHFGNSTSMAWADLDAEIVVTFTCNQILAVKQARQRWKDLSDAVWNAII